MDEEIDDFSMRDLHLWIRDKGNYLLCQLKSQQLSEMLHDQASSGVNLHIFVDLVIITYDFHR
jgi:hypothetical protein